eukprot:gene7031-19742_t
MPKGKGKGKGKRANASGGGGGSASSGKRQREAPPTVVVEMLRVNAYGEEPGQGDDDDDDDDEEEEEEEEEERMIKFAVASFHVEGNEAVKGSIKAMVIDRDECEEAGENFHAVCDEESAELQSVGCDFCNTDGEAGSGRFMYITTVETPAEYSNDGTVSDVTTLALRRFLLLNDFTLAGLPFGVRRLLLEVARAVVSARRRLLLEVARAVAIFHANLGGPPVTQAVKKRFDAFIDAGIVQDRIPFLRAGFLQHPKMDNRLYLTQGLVGNTMTHEEAAAVPTVVVRPLTSAERARAERESTQDMARAFGLSF